MELWQQILWKALEKADGRQYLPGIVIDAQKIVQMECYKTLKKIKEIVEDESLDDPDEESIKASIDLEGREEGSYEVPVDITLPEGYELVDDVVAEINISEISDVSEVENSEE